MVIFSLTAIYCHIMHQKINLLHCKKKYHYMFISWLLLQLHFDVKMWEMEIKGNGLKL